MTRKSTGGESAVKECPRQNGGLPLKRAGIAISRLMGQKQILHEDAAGKARQNEIGEIGVGVETQTYASDFTRGGLSDIFISAARLCEQTLAYAYLISFGTAASANSKPSVQQTAAKVFWMQHGNAAIITGAGMAHGGLQPRYG
jgi:hypothetical protein